MVIGVARDLYSERSVLPLSIIFRNKIQFLALDRIIASAIPLFSSYFKILNSYLILCVILDYLFSALLLFLKKSGLLNHSSSITSSLHPDLNNSLLICSLNFYGPATHIFFALRSTC